MEKAHPELGQNNKTIRFSIVYSESIKQPNNVYNTCTAIE